MLVDVITPSVAPSLLVSCCLPLSSPSTPLSDPLPGEEVGNVAGGVNSI